MKNKHIFKVGAFGLKQTEISILKVFFSLHGYREWYFQLVTDISDVNQIDIWLVEHNKLAFVLKANPKAIHIDICSSKKECIAESDYTFCRPLNMQLLVKMLDKIVVQELKFVPPINDQVVINNELIKDISKSTASTKSWQNYTALVIDDSPTVRTLMKASLHSNGFKVETAESSEQALQAIKSRAYDIIFLDVILPGSIDGYKICKIIKSGSDYKHTPVIMLTSKGSTIDKVRGKLSGSNAYLTKPVDQTALMKSVNKLLRGRSPVRMKQTTNCSNKINYVNSFNYT